MPYVPPALISASISALRGKHPLAVAEVPAMVRAGVPVVDDASKGVRFGSPQEKLVLNEVFKVPGAPPGKPYRAVWEKSPDGYFVAERFAETSLQRQRKDRLNKGKAFLQAKVKGGDLWGLRPTAGKDIAEDGGAVRLIDLAIWYGREQDVADLDALLKWFLKIYPLNVGDLIPNLYLEDIPVEYLSTTNPFAPEPAKQEEYGEALATAPAAPIIVGSVAEIGARIEACVRAKGFEASPRFVSHVVGAWIRGDMVILVGQPGTGKTMFSNLIGECLEAEFGRVTTTKIPIRPDFDEGELIGYERLDGSPVLRQFASDVLKSEDPLGVHLVVLDEFNLASVETYLASVLIALEDAERKVTLPGATLSYLPVDTFILATCNPYIDEPETRRRVSFPTKRRAAVIYMPNRLAESFKEAGPNAIVEHAVREIRAESARIAERAASGRATVADGPRQTALETITDAKSLTEEVRAALLAVGTAVLETSEGRSWFTLGVLRDIAIGIALAPRDATSELTALGEAVADKIVPQLRGPVDRADDLLAAVAGLPNVPLIEEVLERTKQGPTDQLVQIL